MVVFELLDCSGSFPKIHGLHSILLLACVIWRHFLLFALSSWHLKVCELVSAVSYVVCWRLLAAASNVVYANLHCLVTANFLSAFWMCWLPLGVALCYPISLLSFLELLFHLFQLLPKHLPRRCCLSYCLHSNVRKIDISPSYLTFFRRSFHKLHGILQFFVYACAIQWKHLFRHFICQWHGDSLYIRFICI